MKGLTQKQQEILDFIADFNRREAMAPTVYEIAENFGIKSATAFAHLRSLQRKGYVTRKPMGKGFLYKAKVKSDRANMSMVQDLLERAFGGSAALLVAALLDTRKVRAKDLDEIKRLIAEREGGK